MYGKAHALNHIFIINMAPPFCVCIADSFH